MSTLRMTPSREAHHVRYYTQRRGLRVVAWVVTIEAPPLHARLRGSGKGWTHAGARYAAYLDWKASEN